MQELSPHHQIVNNNNNHIHYLDDTTHDDSFGDGFHLPKSVSALADMYKCETESLVSSVTSKRRIDMLFGDSRSVVSEYHVNRKYHEPRQTKSLVEGADDDSYYDEEPAKNDVQERIEMMFSEISSSEQEATTNKFTAVNKFVVQHVGSMAVQGKINSVRGLQEPLSELFFKYCKQKRRNTAGLVQIADNGLSIEYSSNYDGKIEKLYPFSSIATWASLKFALKSKETCNEYAFLPMVANPENLFRPLDEEMIESVAGVNNSPLFVVVMREPDSPTKQLSCHGFICQSSEDAVVLAASLYKTLIGKLSKNRVKNKLAKKRARQTSKQLGTVGETSSPVQAESNDYAHVEKPPPPPPPTRPPRKIKDTTKQHQLEDDKRESLRSAETGDVLTKVAIPRSSSFLNTNRLGSRYQDTKPVEVQRMTGSPLGFVEMFNELQTHEGLQTVDEILNVIIKAEGMSFNDLKPIYKEFLLKLALVLSKDELYHRSKSIMNSQKNKDKPSRLKKVITIKGGLKNAFRKPLVKLKKDSCSCMNANTKTYDGTSTDSFFLTDRPNVEDVKLRQTKNVASGRHKTFRFRSQLITSTSEDSDYPKVNQRKFKSKIKEDPLRPSSSGYFSFSECSYDTESCTCTSADKCYCSLSKQKQHDRKPRTNYTPCNCDTMTCNKRNKCYCSKPSNRLSLVEQLKQKGFAVSESSLSPEDTHKKVSVKDKSNTKLSKSLEYLESGSKKYKSRMELYENGQKAYPCRHTYQYSPSSFSSESSRTSQKRSVSSDNLAVDYSMFAKSDDRLARDTNHMFRGSKRVSRKQNVVYAELACPQIGPGAGFKRTYSIPQILPSVRMDSPPMLAVYPHAAMRTCTCACSCPMFTGEPFPTCKTVHPASTPFYQMNMENIFGYYP